jgi:hypothetical protein
VLQDKHSFVTGHGLLLQEQQLRIFENRHEYLRERLPVLEVSLPMHSSNLHHSTVIHHGADILSLDYCPPKSNSRAMNYGKSSLYLHL